MQRRHFELERGYLNIDDEALYFTRSGNWQEAKATQELTAKARPGKTLHQLFGVALMLVAGAFNLLRSDDHGPVNLLFSIGVAGLGMRVLYHALRHDLAPNFRIPWSKLVSATSEGQGTLLRWQDGDGKDRTRRIRLPRDAEELIHARLHSKAAR